ncbi:hypothetical protein NL300_28395, partial [Klebsiella pneumoniae]|nr:hypothetical protein [Klebsiella pneumoniae]
LKLDDPHAFIYNNIHKTPADLYDEIKTHGFEFELSVFSQLPLYESVEYIIRTFDLDDQSNAHLQFFLDHVFAYAEKNQNGLYG